MDFKKSANLCVSLLDKWNGPSMMGHYMYKRKLRLTYWVVVDVRKL